MEEEKNEREEDGVVEADILGFPVNPTVCVCARFIYRLSVCFSVFSLIRKND